MQSHRLEELASFVRDLGSECTALVIHSNTLIAGSKNGRIVAWDIGNGHEKWALQVNGPVSDIGISDRIYVTASAELHAIEIEHGILEWTKDIGGSSDLIKVDNDSIFVTSSLYEIEMEDYTETTLFKFDKNAELIHSMCFEEKPWFMVMQEQKLILGIGRPRCGYLVINRDYEIKHKKIKDNSPITLGVETKSGFLLGHSNGTITEIKDGQINIIQFEDAPITSISTNNDDWCIGNDQGEVMSSNNWERNLVGRIDCLVGLKNLILAATTTNKNSIYLLNENNGETKYLINHDSRIRLMKNMKGKVAVSDQNGKIILLEEEILFRRLNEIKDISQDQGKRDLLKKRLRALRK
jgi:outer membrane protein assembly factor BamB